MTCKRKKVITMLITKVSYYIIPLLFIFFFYVPKPFEKGFGLFCLIKTLHLSIYYRNRIHIEDGHGDLVLFSKAIQRQVYSYKSFTLKRSKMDGNHFLAFLNTAHSTTLV